MPLDEDVCKKKLTTYDVTSIRKISANDPRKDPTTWAKTEHTKEALSQEEMAKQIKKLNAEGQSVTEKKLKLRHFMQSQVNQVLDALKNGETDANFEWSLAQIDQNFEHVWEKKEKKKEKKRATTVLTVYAKRAPRSGVNAIGLYQVIERMKAEAMMGMMIGQRQEPPQEPIRVNDAGRLMSPKARRGRRYHDDSSSYSGLTSETDSDLSYSSSENTTISSRSGRRPRRDTHNGRRSRSHSRRREHRRVAYVPDVPRAVATAGQVAAAYHAGVIDAEAERLERYPRPRPIISTGVLERIPPEPRYADERYADELRLREEDRLRRREEQERRRFPNPFARRYPPSLSDSW